MDTSLDRFLSKLHTGQWFTYSDPKNKSFETLELTEYGKKEGYELPTEADFKAWQQEQEKKEKEREVIAKRKKEYGSADVQFEKILENINSGTDPIEALKKEAKRIRDIKEKYPK